MELRREGSGLLEMGVLREGLAVTKGQLWRE